MNVTYRLAQPEDVQYFQFDKEGNMYIFEPGAGCTGVPRMVQPGEELHLSSSSDVTFSVETVKYEGENCMQDSQVEFSQMDIPAIGKSQGTGNR